MSKSIIALALSLGAVGATQAADLTGEFCMFDVNGGPVSDLTWGTVCDEQVTGTIGAGLFNVASPQLFFSANWTAHDGVTFGPGTYTIDTIQGGMYTDIVVGPNQVGGHILFDWLVSFDIDVVLVWDITLSSVDANTILVTYTSTDNPGFGTGQGTILGSDPYNLQDGVLGNAIIDVSFIGFNPNFNFSAEEADTTPPVITLIGPNPQPVVINTAYVELGADCVDASPQQAFTYTPVIDPSAVNTAVLGDYPVTYDCQDANSNVATTVTRTVSVVPPDAVVTLSGVTPVVHECESSGFTYTDAGAQCDDPEDGSWTNDPLTWPAGTSLLLNPAVFDVTVPSVTYNLTWTCTDSDANTGTAIRVVNVEDNTAPAPGPYTIKAPVGTIVGSVMTLETNEEVAYANMNPTLEAVTDGCDTTVPSLVMTSDTVDFNIASTNNVVTSTLNYTTTDASGNVMNAPLTVNVYRSEPVITLVGGNLTLNVGDAYVEQGIDIFDAQDGSISGVTTSGVVTPTTAGTDPASPRDLSVTIDSSTVDTGTQGTYQVTYDVTDFDGNTAAQVIRTITVGVFATGSNFSMLDSSGSVFGGTNDIVFDWDGTSTNTDETDTSFGLMEIFSEKPQPFVSFVWTAHHIRVFGPGTYTFDTTCTAAQYDAGTTVCNGPLGPGQTEQFMTMTVGSGQIGAHILFDWNTASDIDVVNVWDVDGVWDQLGKTDPQNQLWSGAAGDPPDPATTWKLVSTDVNDDGFNSSPMVDGAFIGFYANFNAGPAGTAPPPEPFTGTAPDTKIGSGLFASPMNPWVLFAVFMTLFGVRRLSK